MQTKHIWDNAHLSVDLLHKKVKWRTFPVLFWPQDLCISVKMVCVMIKGSYPIWLHKKECFETNFSIQNSLLLIPGIDFFKLKVQQPNQIRDEPCRIIPIVRRKCTETFFCRFPLNVGLILAAIFCMSRGTQQVWYSPPLNYLFLSHRRLTSLLKLEVGARSREEHAPLSGRANSPHDTCC